MSAHTPGPWELGALRNDGATRRITWSGVSPGAVCEVFTDLSGKGEWDAALRDANARLIAAAPDMLRALRVVATTCRATDLPAIAWQAIQDALAKAESK